MDRKEFIALMGVTTGGLILASCMGGCKKTQAVSNISADFTLDLTASANAALKNNGGYLITNGVIVGRTMQGGYIAVGSACTHEGQSLTYQASSQRFYCPRHGATYNESGSVTNGPASVNLQQFKTTLTGTSLRVYS